jgi:hypothetical protein
MGVTVSSGAGAGGVEYERQRLGVLCCLSSQVFSWECRTCEKFNLLRKN